MPKSRLRRSCAPPRDPVMLAAMCGVLLLTGLFAAWWPASRAAATEPMQALRTG